MLGNLVKISIKYRPHRAMVIYTKHEWFGLSDSEERQLFVSGLLNGYKDPRHLKGGLLSPTSLPPVVLERSEKWIF